MDRTALTIVLASTAALSVSWANASVLSLGGEAFTASLGEAPARHRIDDDSGRRLESVAIASTTWRGDGSMAVKSESSAMPNDLAGIDSISLVPTAGGEAVTGDFGDLTMPASDLDSGSVSGGSTPLASQGADPKGMPSTSESESGGFAPPDWSLTEEGRNLSVGPQTESNGTTGTDLTPISVPGSGIAALGSIAIAGFRRRR